jgi:hypothetical protein
VVPFKVALDLRIREHSTEVAFGQLQIEMIQAVCPSAVTADAGTPSSNAR